MSFVRLTAAVNKVRAGNPRECVEEIKQLLAVMPQSDFTVFPSLALCGNCGNLSSHRLFGEQCDAALKELAALTAEREGYIIVGLLSGRTGHVAAEIAVIHRGEILNTGAGRTAELFTVGDFRFCVAYGVNEVVHTNCDLVIIPACIPVYAGKFDELCGAAKAASKQNGCAVALVNGGVGETSSPNVYRGFVAVFEDGEALFKEQAGYESFYRTVDLDADIIRANRKYFVDAPVFYGIDAVMRTDVLREVDPVPFLPKENRDEYIHELFDLQVRSLVSRVENIGISRLVLGVSGGLDSTAALLCCCAAADTLGLPRGNIIAVTMPGFGTSDATYYNALSLIQQLGATCRDISIRQSVLQHFEDIGHSGKKDVVYENAQARERAQVLLDLANAAGGMVVGTGDLSEAALGFTTFAGDHIANYNVNISITKTVLRAMVRHLADGHPDKNIAELLYGVLETPVSPELLPAEEDGGIRQKTEDILAPYELLDFFLYYFIKYRFAPSKLLLYAQLAFGEKYGREYLKEKLRMFIQRFSAAQFKRSCAPDGAALTEVNLVGFYMPGDFDSGGLLRELDEM